MNKKSEPFRVNWKKLPTVIVGLFSLREKAPTKKLFSARLAADLKILLCQKAGRDLFYINL